MKLAQDGDRQAYALVLEHCREAFSRLARERCPAGVSEIEIVQGDTTNPASLSEACQWCKVYRYCLRKALSCKFPPKF